MTISSADPRWDIRKREYALIGEEIYSGKLPNGLSVFVAPKRGFHKSYAFFATDFGGADRRFKLSGNWIDTPEGVAHFLEHKMFDMEDGTNALMLLSGNGASPNAYTSPDITAYHFECVENFMENLQTLLSFVTTPYFTPESVEKEQGIIGQEIRMSDDDPDHCLYYGLMKSLFRSNPLRDSVAGTIESIAEITSDTLYDCHRVFYNPSNMALCVVGDVDHEEVFDIAHKTTPGDPGETPERDYGPRETLKPEAESFSKNMEISLPLFLAGCKSEPAPRGRETLRLDLTGALALDILAGHSSPLYFRLYDEGLVNSTFSASYESALGAAYTIFGGETREPERVFREVCDEILRISGDGPDAAMFGRIKKAAVGSQIRALNSFSAISGGIVEGHFRGYDTFETPEILESIEMDDITAFFRERLSPADMAISIISPIE